MAGFFRWEQVDVPLLLAMAAGIAAVVGALELLRRFLRLHEEVSRKAVHLGTGVLVFFAPMLGVGRATVLVLSLAFALVNALACRFRWLKSVHQVSRASYGTAYYPLALFILAALFWDEAPALAVAGMAVLALGDGLAGIAGELLPAPRMYRVTSDRKSVQGSAVMLLASAAALVATFAVYGLPVRPGAFPAGLWSPLPLLLLAAAALFATAWEAASSRGLDNLTVPVATGCALAIALRSEDAALLFLAGTALAIPVALASHRARFLNGSGAVAVYLLAVVVHGFGGWMWTVPILVFFLPSSLLSMGNRKRKEAFALIFEKSSTRDVWQVAANGGVAGALLLASLALPHPLWYPLYLASLAAAAADTWATELGVLSRGEPRLLTTLRRVPRGSSGAVSAAGLAASAAGAATVALSAMALSTVALSAMALSAVPLTSAVLAAAVVASGVLGALVDSLLGATLQSSYRCGVCSSSTERRSHCGQPAARISGLAWMGNDAVNAACTAAGALCMLILYGILA